MADYAISSANLRYIERSMESLSDGLYTVNQNLKTVVNQVDGLDTKVNTVDGRVQSVSRDLDELVDEFREFVKNYEQRTNVSDANTKLIQIRQELEQKYGHFSEVRKTATGILQANDLGIVKRENITNKADELMLQTPGYWLAPALVALAAWIDDTPEVAEKALKEALVRSEEKTTLFFALVCRRANRKHASLLWMKAYLRTQNEEEVSRETMAALEAYASGLFGTDTEGLLSEEIERWIEILSERLGFEEHQRDEWEKAILLKKKPLQNDNYPYLKKYSETWPQMAEVLEGAYLNGEILDYFTGIYAQKNSAGTVKEQLDVILDSLVTDYDEVEIPLRKEEKLNMLIIKNKGDIKRSKKEMEVEESAFETKKDFMQILTDAAMKPDSSHSGPAMQKFSIALSRRWVTDAYNDVTAKNRMKIPAEIAFKVENFADKTRDGFDEAAVIGRWQEHVEREKQEQIAENQMSMFARFSIIAAAILAVLGVVCMALGKFAVSAQMVLGVVLIIAGVCMALYYASQRSKTKKKMASIEQQFEQLLQDGTQIIRAIMAEVVDFREEFSLQDARSAEVISFLEELSPEQYIQKLTGGNRRVLVNK